MEKKVNAQDKFVKKITKKATELNRDYDFSFIKYTGCNNKVKVWCNKHQEFFEIVAQYLVDGNGCKKCGAEAQYLTVVGTLEKFLEKALLAHEPGHYSYEKVIYKNMKTKVEIVCNYHQISFWIKPTSFAIRQNPFEYGSYTSWGSLNLFQDGQLSFYYTPLNSGGFLNPNTGANKLTLNQWVHVVLVRNYANNTIKIYFNSVEVMNHTTTGTGANPSSGDAVIGKGYAGGGGALIDEFSIYNIALTQTQINSIYNAGNGTTL